MEPFIKLIQWGIAFGGLAGLLWIAHQAMEKKGVSPWEKVLSAASKKPTDPAFIFLIAILSALGYGLLRLIQWLLE